jgi:CheY-like chemotaxis protein
MPAALPRVLVADDQSDVVSALRLLLRAEGFDIDTAATVDEVRARVAADRYDLLLMDLNYARDTTSEPRGSTSSRRFTRPTARCRSSS